MSATPVVLIAFNRPELFARTLAAVRAAEPQRLFFICDGPRAGQTDDAERVGRVHADLKSIDWPAEVRRRMSSMNLGCEANVELGLDWVFSQVDRAIVLEDDCVPEPSFFTFCDELLDRYAQDPRVWHIAGNRHDIPTSLFHGRSYAFSTWASVWGWATWADRWQRHRLQFPRDHRPVNEGGTGSTPVRKTPAVPRAGTLVTVSGQRHFAEAAVSHDVVTHGWDKQWWLSIMAEGGLSVTPSVNLVENVGFGPDATHGNADRTLEPARPMSFPLRHPPRVELDRNIERELELVLSRVGGRMAVVARGFVRSPRLRRVARAVVHSGPSRAAARVLARRGGR